MHPLRFLDILTSSRSVDLEKREHINNANTVGWVWVLIARIYIVMIANCEFSIACYQHICKVTLQVFHTMVEGRLMIRRWA